MPTSPDIFEQLYQHPFALARHRTGPLTEDRRRYLMFRAEQQLSAHSLRCIAGYLLIVANALQLVDRSRERITLDDIEVASDHWAKRHSNPLHMQNCRRSRLSFRRHAVAWLVFLGRLQPNASVRRPYADCVQQFSEYMVRDRGYTRQTVRQRCWTVNKFLAQLKAAGLRLGKLTVPRLDELLGKAILNKGFARKTIRTRLAALRSFLRFAEERGWCRPNLAAAIMLPRIYAHEGVPIGPAWQDVNRLLVAADGDQSKDIRDRALLLLLSVYGLRAGEVVTLRLEDFDWEGEVLKVPPGKRQRPRTYPLCRPVGDAVLRYLREARPKTVRREVFLTLLAPYRALTVGGLGIMVRRRLLALGLALPRGSSHALRHACAGHLLAQGLSLKEIGDHLGHQSPEATRIYAKVNLDGLRLVGEFDLEGLQ
jgi:integrase/recombinase XerD